MRESPEGQDSEQSTFLFCRSNDDGSITPEWDASRDAELKGQFEVGLTVDKRYLLLQKLGNGSMGRVFLAKDLRLERPVAMKVVARLGGGVVDPDSALQREARLGANLNHPGIAAVYDFGFLNDKSYTVFEYVEGETLRQVMQRRGRMPLEEVLQVAHDLAAALDFAHIRGVIHRDLKPENVCCTKRGDFKILDLGLARDIHRDIESSLYCGTPAYSSPEQAQCHLTDGRSDQYALGLIVFEMLTGQKAFVDSQPLRLLNKQINQSPPQLRELLPDLPVEAERAVQRALSKSAEDRFPTCLEFARALSAGLAVPTQRHVVVTATEHRLAFYVGHVAEESLLARQVAEELEQRHYACWYYGRDAIAGVSFSEQSRKAIERSQAVILLVSRAALRSADFAREVEHAHRIGASLLPLLVEISREEFEKLAPDWRRMLGASPAIEVRRNEARLAATIPRLVESAAALGIQTNGRLATVPVEPQPRCHGQIWPTDANQIDINDLQHVLFRNAAIDHFLQGKHCHFIVATKGFGKTLLLTCKRQQLARTHAGPAAAHQTLQMVPEGRPYLDFMSEMRSLSARYEQPLSELSTTKRLWSAALRIAAISHHASILDPEETEELGSFPQRVRRWLGGGKIQPTVVFKELTALRVSELNRFIDRTENFLDQKMRQIHGATCIFIDKVDQAIHHLPREAWIAIQAGLIEAAWETMNANSHLKIFASIRQEAFANYQSDIKSNLFAATTTLNYSEEELHALLDQLAGCYEGSRSFTDFLGLNVVRHGRRPAPEDSYAYVRRHTCGRPRDLVAIASAVSAHRGSLNENRLREIVRQTSSSVLVSNIFDEVRVLLTCLGDRQERLRFLALIPSNILEKATVVRICEEFNGLEPGTLQHFGEDSQEIFHPFRDLYFAGLLGAIAYDAEQGITLQRFRRPHDALAFGATDLPDSPVMLIHPALDTFIRSQRTRSPMLQFQHIPVGENLVWQHYYPTLMQIEKHLQQVTDPRFVDLTHQVIKRVETLRNTSTYLLARAEIQRSDAWQTLLQYEDQPGCDAVLLWLGELLETM